MHKLENSDILENQDFNINFQNHVVNIKHSKWQKFLKTAISKGRRKKFKTSFDEFISTELQKIGVKCWLRHVFNWFHKNPKNLLWRGKYKCIDKRCPRVYSCKIEKNKHKGVVLIISWNTCCIDHLKLKKVSRCVGKEREHLALELIADGNANVRNNNVIHNFINKNSNTQFCLILKISK